MTIFITPQVQTVPSIPWDFLQAPALATPTERYQGYLPGSGVRAHSADSFYAVHGVHLRCIESASGRRLWQAIDKSGKVIAAHPKHSGCSFIATAILTGA
jgi:hypothetical protein